MNNRRSRSSPDDQAKQGEIRFRCPCAAQRRGRWDAARTGACEMAEIEWNSSLDRSRGLGNYAAASGRHRFVCQQRRLCSGSVFFLPFLVFFPFSVFFRWLCGRVSVSRWLCANVSTGWWTDVGGPVVSHRWKLEYFGCRRIATSTPPFSTSGAIDWPFVLA